MNWAKSKPFRAVLSFRISCEHDGQKQAVYDHFRNSFLENFPVEILHESYVEEKQETGDHPALWGDAYYWAFQIRTYSRSWTKLFYQCQAFHALVQIVGSHFQIDHYEDVDTLE